MKTAGFAVLLATLCVSVFAETVKDREAAVRNDRAAMEKDARWIFNDTERGFAEAKRKGKPLLVVLRCVPCLSCMGIDASVLTEPLLAPLLDQFVCVRVINANALDLARFQFDYDLSFSTLFFATDGTVLGRFGSWKHQRDSKDTTSAGYMRALNAALAIHREYPANKSALAGKQGAPTPFKTPVEIPTLAGKYTRDLDWEGKVVQSCVHCHQIGDAFRASFREAGKPVPEEMIFPMPAPETIGLTLAADHIARVESAATGSAAEKAGVAAGDDFVSLAGQPLVSIADMSWALDRAPESGTLAAVVKRGADTKPVGITLAAGWRAKADISKRVGTWQMRGMASGGLVLEDLPDEARTPRGIEKDTLALLVKSVGQYGKHAAAKNAGFQKDDVIVAAGSLTARMSEGEWLGHFLRKQMPGEKVKVTVLRGTERTDLSLPMQ